MSSNIGTLGLYRTMANLVFPCSCVLVNKYSCTSNNLWFKPKTLNEKTGNFALILYKTNGQHAVLSAYYAPFPLSPEILITLIFTANLVGGANVVFVSLFINRAIRTTLWASQTSADHEQGEWSVSGARSLVKRCAHFIVPLLGNGIIFLKSHSPNWSP